MGHFAVQMSFLGIPIFFEWLNKKKCMLVSHEYKFVYMFEHWQNMFPNQTILIFCLHLPMLVEYHSSTFFSLPLALPYIPKVKDPMYLFRLFVCFSLPLQVPNC